MSRLILVPQYPTKLRYQEWWFEEFPNQFAKHFDEVLTLDGAHISSTASDKKAEFAPLNQAIEFEIQQMEEYRQLTLKKDDILLLNDLSFPGLFASMLIHKRPSKCYAICHATSKNKHDYFIKNRTIKYPIERATAKLFNCVFVATRYHRSKLNWSNIEVTGLPFPPFKSQAPPTVFDGKGKQLKMAIVSVARPGIQKHNKKIENLVEKALKLKIQSCHAGTWEEYYKFLAGARLLLITSKEETFGYQVIDAIKNGCIPIAPNKFSYPEILPRECLYDDSDELLRVIKAKMFGKVPILIGRKDWYLYISKLMKKY